MLEKGKISALQMGIIAYPMILGSNILSAPSIIGREAGRDLWISPIWASFMGFVSVYLAYRLNRIYPEETLIQYSEHILGRLLGKILGFFYLFFLLHNIGNFLRQFAEFVLGAFLPETPVIVALSGLVLLCAYAVLGGLEVIGRLAQLFVPLFIFPLLIMVVILLHDYELENLFPIFEHGIMPSVKGAVIPGLSWFTEYFMLAFLFPFITDRDKGKKWGMISVLTVTITMIVSKLMTLLLFGETLISSYLYPVFEAARYAHVLDFFEHLEAIVIVVWVAGVFLKVSIFYYALVLGTAQWFKLSDYHPIVFPIGLLIILFGIWGQPNLPEITEYYRLVSPFYKIFFLLVIPLCLLFLARIRKGNNEKMGERQK
jgi:spore germination protein KB